MEEKNRTTQGGDAAHKGNYHRRKNNNRGQKKSVEQSADKQNYKQGGAQNKQNSPQNKSGSRSDRQEKKNDNRQGGGRNDRRPQNRRGGGRGFRREAPLPEDIRMRHNEYEANYEADEELLDERMSEFHDGAEGDSGAVIGRNAVRELLKSDRTIDKILVRRGDREGSIVVLVAEAVSRGIPIIEVEKAKLDALSGFAPHQGIIAMAAAKEYCAVEDILAIAKARGEKPLIVVADGIVDPYNLGALIRCAEGAGAHGIIIPKRRAVGLTPLVTKASAGAIEHMAIAKVANIAQTLSWLKKQGVWTYAAEAGGKSYHDTDFRGPAAIVFGSEGDGVSHLILDNCDFVTSIPMYGQVNSLNVSTAAAVILSEAARQQRLD